MEEDDMVKSRYGNTSYGERRTDERGRVASRGAYKEVPRPSRRLALATPESPRVVHPSRAKSTLITST